VRGRTTRGGNQEGATITGDNGKNAGDKGALGISLLGVVKFQYTQGTDYYRYATAFENV